MSYIPSMEWEVEFTNEFEDWWNSLSEDEQADVNAKVILLQKLGPSLPRPHADLIHSSRHANMKELRIQHSGRPYRVLFAFDPRRCAILLIGGDKTGNDRWYEEFVPVADGLYDQHLEALTMAKNFKELQDKMPREARLRSEASAAKMISEMGLAELRAAMDMTQESLANALHVKQASISKMERRSDMYISTLSKIIEAMGGELQIVAKMPNGNVKIRQFTQVRQDESETASALS
jgi:DNA-binding XRE family transcriptional regulator